MKANEIRQKFLDFFKEKKHLIVSSAPLVIKNDPTLLFTNAGMNPFKDFFLGHKPIADKRIANTQKCLRVSGKHNDLEEVGIDTYHHTLFEMLGNWSFGDYFKKESIAWAWELLTEVYHLPKERLYVTVFEGDPSEKLDFDQEAYDLWKQFISEDRIIRGSKKDNFWEMGETGPCGPCSEIHIDLRSEEKIKKIPGKSLVNTGDPEVIEVWNLVFMQFNRLANGKLESLPAKHVDTGMGFERLVRAIQQKSSNYDTDVFQPIIQFIEQQSKIKYGSNEKTDIAMRVLADHIRAVSFAIADGQLPSNNKAGYVIRRILRRAVRYAYTFLHFKEPFLYQLVPILAAQFKGVFDELFSQKEFVAKVIQEEENSFLRTLENGIKKFEQSIEKNKISGKVAFELYDTFGFPLDLTQLLAREKNIDVDVNEFEKEMQIQKERSRQADSKETGDWIHVHPDENVKFSGYNELESTSTITKYRLIKTKDQSYYQIILNKTPFYAESGGQIGDTGYLEVGKEKIEIIDTKKENELIIHITKKLPTELKASVKSVVNKDKRIQTQNNHTATHLLHAALKNVLGNHVNQKGSYVSDELLRFDFSHFTKMTEEEIEKVEQLVNQKIRENIPSDIQEMPIEKAQQLGAMALFGEKYGNVVRVVTFDKDYSIELCGGTHVAATGTIGFFKITSESSVAAGVRRIEAITGKKSEDYILNQLKTIDEIKESLKNPKDLKKAIDELVNEKNELTKQIDVFHQQQAQHVKDYLLTKVEKKGDIHFIAEKVNLPSAESMKQIAFELKSKIDSLFLLIAAEINGKPQIAIMISDDLVKNKNLHAGNLVKELAKEINGGGGGQAFYATAGGTELNGLEKILKKIKEQNF